MEDLKELLHHIDPGRLTYQEWVNCGMALKLEGYPVSVWDEWSALDRPRYKAGDCEKKWRSFDGSSDPVTGGTIYQLAVEQGWAPDAGRALDWDDVIRADTETVIVDPAWLEAEEIKEPDKKDWKPVKQIITYLETLFEASENVGYVMQSYQNDKGKYVPQNTGSYTRTAGQLIEELSKCKGDIGAVLGDYDKAGGAWIRFNPLDGQGVKNANVTECRYALVESDEMDLGQQYALLKKLELPIAVVVHSGRKSIHAIVKVDAPDYAEYRKRVDYLYDVCEKNGMHIDKQNRNPSRLSRLPGIERGDKKQFIIATNIGHKSWNEWKEWIEGINDDLPDVEGLEDAWGSMPALADALISGVLRKGHKMLIVGPSKSGKSFLQIELCIAIAEGRKWLGWQCAKGSVLYVNLELDRASCLHRFKDVYETLKVPPDNLKNISIWNLRGKSVAMDKLAPKLIRRAQKRNYVAIIIDPIYKVITGDENSADQMARFCNQFDRICSELGCAVIYCHHHSKGTQGQKKSMDRASGSGVFARDPDALLDMIELETTADLMKQVTERAACEAARSFLQYAYKGAWDWKNDLSQDDWLNVRTVMNICENKIDDHGGRIEVGRFMEYVDNARKGASRMTAWRIEGTLREFPAFPPVNIWFDYPVHRADESGALKDVQPEEEKSSWQKSKEKRREQAAEERKKNEDGFRIAFEGLVDDSGIVPIDSIAEQIGVSIDTIGRWFGNTKKSRASLKKEFKFTTTDGVRYVKKIEQP